MDKTERSKGDTYASNYAVVDKTKVLQDAKECFRAVSGKTSKLVDVLTKCIYLMLKGEKLTNSEATDLFLDITFLFQYKSKDNTLRRLIYIAIKALSHQADQPFAVTASLMADAGNTRHDPTVRASALRALCQIADTSTSEAVERFLRQSIVDKHPVVASAALTSLIHIAKHNSEIVKRCSDEIQEVLKSDSPMLQYHALALSQILFMTDQSATSKLLNMCIDMMLSSPLATCLLLRILASYINDSPTNNNVDRYIRYISDCLDHKSEMVAYEAAKTILVINNNPTILAKNKSEETAAIGHLRNLLTASKPTLRYSAVRLLNDHSAASLDTRCWSIQRIGNLCKLHLLTKRYKPGDEIIGMLEFADSNVVCAKYTCTLQCESTQLFQVKQEFSLGYKQTDFVITIPEIVDETTCAQDDGATLHCILSFLFYITDRNYPRALFEDKAGTIELGPNEIETKQFSCDFPILINTLQCSRVNTCVAGANVGAINEQVH